jgi:hypothetical protein
LAYHLASFAEQIMSDRKELEKPDTAEICSVPRRRRLVQGLGAGVLTVSARSALATGTCLSPSAKASIAMLGSRPDRAGVPCTGRTPGYWKNAPTTHAAVWEGLFKYINDNKGPYFNVVFGSGFSGKTILEVMNLGGGLLVDPHEFGAHLSAAYCNWLKGWVPPSILTDAELKKMWLEGSTGSYQPVAGVSWGPEQIVAYLKTTMPL